MKNYPNKRTLLFYFFSMLFLGSFLYNTIEITVLKYNPNIEKESLDIFVNTILQFAIYLVLVIGIALLMRQFYEDDFFDFKQKFLKNILVGFIGWVSMYGLLIIWGMILTTINYEAATPVNQLEIEKTFFSYPLLMIPVLTLAAPFVEETIFRGVIFKSINNSKLKYKTIIAFIMSSCLFGFIHVFSAFLISRNVRDIIDGIPYFISGFALTFVYFKTKNIFVPMITHFLYNTAATVLLLIVYLIQEYFPEELITNTIYILLHVIHLQ
ncbi:MAG: hypothetical protein K0Q49_764 [Haloplasmataceae bacterium]|jgi:membrane protease YdiL (CAAX protease family)|nr:hypothetical protein [Haloplasmataceae bacterium]